MNNKILSIQYMRGIAALLVVLFHFRMPLNGVYEQKNLGDLLFINGSIGVDLFFIISGYIISFATEKPESTITFALKRIFRIWPVYIFLLISMCLIDNSDYSFIKSLFFIHADYSKHAPFFGYSMIASAWTLTFEIYFYIIFMISMCISHKYRILISSLSIMTLNISLQYIFNHEYSLAGYATAHYYGFMTPAIKVLSSPMMLEFVCGMLAYRLLSLFNKSNNEILISFLRYFFYASAIYFIYVFSSGYNANHGLFGFGIASLLLFISVVALEKTSCIFHSKIMLKLGDLSYSMYISHIVVSSYLIYYAANSQWYVSSEGFSKLFLRVSLTIFVSGIVYNIIEKPFIKVGRYFISRIK
ncbi:TPA: acyltransferase [Escherichia coli]|nr:acyltransferase [Escherichia coli]HCJ9721765.1 acyltransferase [Escherichia coli]